MIPRQKKPRRIAKKLLQIKKCSQVVGYKLIAKVNSLYIHKPENRMWGKKNTLKDKIPTYNQKEYLTCKNLFTSK